MASGQQQPNQARKMSNGNKAGSKDVLSRMLQMEREVKDQRAPATNLISPSESQWVSPNRDVRHAFQSPSSPVSVPPRSQMRPMPSGATGQPQTSKTKVGLKLDTAEVKEDLGPNEICLSPSWSDHGEKKRRKEKKQRDRERKGREKKVKETNGGKKEQRKDEGGDRQKPGGIKAGKRAGKKPPPAAMETQKMPSGLRRNSLVSIFSSRSSSREGSRRNSLSGDDRRLSGISFSSFTSGRSRTTPPTSEESADSSDQYRKTVSSTAPRLPSFNWKSWRDSNDISKSVAAWNHEAAYEKEVVGFAYRLDTKAFIAESEKIEEKRSQPGQQPRKSHFKEHTDTSSTTQRVSTAPESPPKKPTRPVNQQQEPTRQKLRKRKKVDVTMRDQVLKNSGAAAAAAGPSTNGTPKSAPPVEGRKKRPETPLALELPATQVKPAYDGSSYVHKQRLYQQQMSIAGFEEQQTVQLANEVAARKQEEDEAESKVDTAPEMPVPNRQAAALRNHQDHWRDSQSTLFPLTAEDRILKDTPPQSRKHTLKQSHSATPLSQSTKTAIMGDHPPPSSLGRHPMYAQDPETPKSLDAPLGTKSDKMLSFRKRPKPPPLGEGDKLPDGHQNPLSSHPVRPEEPASRRSRMEKMFIDPISAQIPFKKRANSAGSANIPPSPEKDSPGTFRGHYRNRTNSSEALTMDLPSPVPRAWPMEIPKPLSGNVHEQARASSLERKVSKPKRSVEVPKQDKLPGDSNEANSEISSLSAGEGPNHSRTVSDDTNQLPSPAPEEPKPAETKELTRYTLVETIQPKVQSPKESPPTTEATPLKNLKPILKRSRDAMPGVDTATAAPKTELEMVAQRINKGGVPRKTSTLSGSGAQPPKQTTPTTPLPALDFLPQLKHQPLVKRTSPPRTTSDSVIPRFPAPPPSPLSPLAPSPLNTKIASTSVNVPALKPRSPLRSPVSPLAMSHDNSTTTSTTNNKSGIPHHPSSPAAAAAAAAAATSATQPPTPLNRSSTSIFTTTTAASTSSLLSKDITTTTATATANIDNTISTAAVSAKPIAKLFIICCKCRYWHDLPSKVYEAMAFPKEVQSIKAREEEENNNNHHLNLNLNSINNNNNHNHNNKNNNNSAVTQKSSGGAAGGAAAEGGGVKLPDTDADEGVNDKQGKTKEIALRSNGGGGSGSGSGSGSSVVSCPWCEHAMSTWCCQGWTTVVYLHERHH